MKEVTYLVETADPVLFCGVNNGNIHLLKALYPKVRIIARGNAIKAGGDDADIDAFVGLLERMEAHINDFNTISDDIIRTMAKGGETIAPGADNLILHGVNGKPITARTPHQRELCESFRDNDLVFAIGPAGSGKTYTAIALAVSSLKTKRSRKIILSRPAVEAGEKLGFLPGDLKEKIDPYLRPLYDALEDMVPPFKLKEYLENGTIQIAPLAYMRGRTLSDAVIILDEAQNTTPEQMKMFLTRLGFNSKMIVTGDATQIDLPGKKSGLIESMRILGRVKGIGRINFDKGDIIRHRLVSLIVEAYDEDGRLKRENAAKEASNDETDLKTE